MRYEYVHLIYTCLHLLTSSLVGNFLNICKDINEQVKVSARYIVSNRLLTSLNPQIKRYNNISTNSHCAVQFHLGFENPQWQMIEIC